MSASQYRPQFNSSDSIGTRVIQMQHKLNNVLHRPVIFSNEVDEYSYNDYLVITKAIAHRLVLLGFKCCITKSTTRITLSVTENLQ